MTVLIHLNGPSGVGKSTLAQQYVDDHPGTLALDIDHVVAMIGGWRDDFFATLAPARSLALAMAGTHLAAGSDVIMPQLVTDVDQAARFESVATAAGAEYVEVALVVGTDEQRRRFRDKPRDRTVDQQVLRHVDERGGDTLLERIHTHVTTYLDQRPTTRRVATDELSLDSTYECLLDVLGR